MTNRHPPGREMQTEQSRTLPAYRVGWKPVLEGTEDIDHGTDVKAARRTLPKD
jgi:hypothetical protein